MSNSVLMLKTIKEVRIAFDPYRIKIIELYYKKKEPLTAKQAADFLGEEPSKVHYHIQKLIGINVLGLSHTKVINGIIAKYYKLKYEDIKVDKSVRDTKFYQIYREDLHNTNFNIYVEWFSKDIARTDVMMQSKEKLDPLDSHSYYTLLYMTKEERSKVMKQIREILKPFEEVDYSKNEYSYLRALSIRELVPNIQN